MKKFPDLNSLISLLNDISDMQISVADFSGILSNKELFVEDRYRGHESDFCGKVSMTTPAGILLCYGCKDETNQRVKQLGRPFVRMCPFGIYEAVCPVVKEGKTLCAVYCGGYFNDREQSLSRLKKVCEKAGISYDSAKAPFLSANADSPSSSERYEKTAAFVADYISSCLSVTPAKERSRAVEYIVKCIDLEYSSDLKLSDFAEQLYINPKHLGRMFKKRTGKSFNEYLTKTRLDTAEKLLQTTDRHIIDIAYMVGYNNVTYFNRAFKERFGMTPTEARTGKNAPKNREHE